MRDFDIITLIFIKLLVYIDSRNVSIVEEFIVCGGFPCLPVAVTALIVHS